MMNLPVNFCVYQYSHCIVAFVLLTFFVIDYDDKATLVSSQDCEFRCLSWQ